ncbi:hypothetical protein AAFF_G00206120 [Aldrovandia affinis]|uniref:Uncharacterized protein n=1 Tax=Aldrovandia affinis TaxID=143900 RepID=A0AAD7W692_9TELE|nr:hypothetical protein AAFF_G00206120 [Aldrovandia affinis]
MTEEFDEDVVFENSPLFQYLQDLGHTDFEACPTVSQEEEQCAGGEEGPFPQDVPPPPELMLSHSLSRCPVGQSGWGSVDPVRPRTERSWRSVLVGVYTVAAVDSIHLLIRRASLLYGLFTPRRGEHKAPGMFFALLRDQNDKKEAERGRNQEVNRIVDPEQGWQLRLSRPAGRDLPTVEAGALG